MDASNLITSLAYAKAQQKLLQTPRTWLVTGVAGFIGSHLLENLLTLNQQVVGLDNFATGYQHNLDNVQTQVTPAQWDNFTFIPGDIRQLDHCHQACQGVDYVLHQAALGSVPRSLDDPITTNSANITGFLNMLVAAKEAGVKSFTYAGSSSTYGDHPALPKVEGTIGAPLNPYAVTKYVNELYAQVFSRCYGLATIGLRYFNVFGPRQNPQGAYAAVMPRWITALANQEPVYINGDGDTSRDFCYVDNAVQANILAATTTNPQALNQVYNVAVSDRNTLNTLYTLMVELLEGHGVKAHLQPLYRDFREGDVRHSQADITKAKQLLGYVPSHCLHEGLKATVAWFVHQT